MRKRIFASRSLLFYASIGVKKYISFWWQSKFASWFSTLVTLTLAATTNRKDDCVVDPSNGLQTSKLISVCATSCTAHISSWQAMVIRLHSCTCDHTLKLV